MGSQILRPTTVKHEKGQWLVHGPWGRRYYEPMSKVDFYERLRCELVESGVLQADSPHPSNKYHDHVTMPIMRSSRIGDRWVPDEPFAARLKKLREQAKLTQEQLAEKSGLDVGTIRQLEQGTRINPQWQTVCALARGLAMDVLVFVGTDGWQPAESEEQTRKREHAEKLHIIEADIIMRLEALGHLFDRRIDQNRKTEMKSMSKPELQQLAQTLRSASTAQKANSMIVAAICASKDARRAEEEKEI
jgi:transcriptional regulator with XRE-family HTH domain